MANIYCSLELGEVYGNIDYEVHARMFVLEPRAVAKHFTMTFVLCLIFIV